MLVVRKLNRLGRNDGAAPRPPESEKATGFAGFAAKTTNRGSAKAELDDWILPDEGVSRSRVIAAIIRVQDLTEATPLGPRPGRFVPLVLRWFAGRLVHPGGHLELGTPLRPLTTGFVRLNPVAILLCTKLLTVLSALDIDEQLEEIEEEEEFVESWTPRFPRH